MPETIATTNEVIGGPNRSRVKSIASAPVPVVLNLAQAMLYGYAFYSGAAAAAGRFVKFYDTAGTVTVGTTIPAFTVAIVSTTTVAGQAVANFDEAIPFKNGLQYAITGGVADTDTTVCVLDDINGVILWK